MLYLELVMLFKFMKVVIMNEFNIIVSIICSGDKFKKIKLFIAV